MMEFPPEFIRILKKSRNVAVLTGAGISAESGVPTFRGKEGLWSKFRPEELATVQAFMNNPKLVWEWYLHRREIMGEVVPNPGHLALVEMEGLFENFTLITQNVDDLHRRAGSRDILELHGNITKNKCLHCQASFDREIDLASGALPRCDCGGPIRPDVVWFGEMLPERTLERAFQSASKADLFFSIGTSALVHPAASLPVVALQSGACLVEINLEPTPLTELANFSWHGPAGEILPDIVAEIKK